MTRNKVILQMMQSNDQYKLIGVLDETLKVLGRAIIAADNAGDVQTATMLRHEEREMYLDRGAVYAVWAQICDVCEGPNGLHYSRCANRVEDVVQLDDCGGCERGDGSHHPECPVGVYEAQEDDCDHSDTRRCQAEGHATGVSNEPS